MGRKRASPTVELDLDWEELEMVEELVKEYIGEIEVGIEEFPEADLEKLIEKYELKEDTWYEVYWSG